MSFLIFAVPIVAVIIGVIVIGVFASDSKGYQRKLSNSKQMELERAREEALRNVAEIKRLKSNREESVFSENTTHHEKSQTLMEEKDLLHKQARTKDLKEQKELARSEVITKDVATKPKIVNKYQQYYNENYNKGNNKFAKQRSFQEKEVVFEKPKLVFSKENIVRGLVANEYLNRKQGRRL